MKKILIIDGHPNKDSLCYSLAEAYLQGAAESGAEVKKLRLMDLSFNPILLYGYQKRTELEPDLLNALDLLKWADHLVWVHPVWWSGVPAIVKGFLDRLFLPGLTYNTIPNSVMLEGLLKNKTAHIIATLDQPAWFYRFYFGAPSEKQLKSSLKLCGVKTKKMSYFGIVKTSTEEKRKLWIEQVKQYGREAK